jgi:VWFA-related protein
LLGPELLQSVAEQTGGKTFLLSSANDMPVVTRTIGTQLRDQYMLAYQPQTPPHDGKWHKINVKLLLPKALRYSFHIAARPGYYAGEVQGEAIAQVGRRRAGHGFFVIIV